MGVIKFIDHKKVKGQLSVDLGAAFVSAGRATVHKFNGLMLNRSRIRNTPARAREGEFLSIQLNLHICKIIYKLVSFPSSHQCGTTFFPTIPTRMSLL